jgi:hypothetical protein
MTLRFVIIRSVLALPLLGLVEAQAQSFVTQKPAAATEAPSPQASPTPQTAANLPDACKLLTQADLEALFPGRPITSKGGTLSPVFKGPQYNQSCMYMVKLPSPTSKSETGKFASVTIVNWGGQTDGRNGSVATFASIRAMQEKVAPSSRANMRIETLQGVGEEAFQEVSDHQVAIRARKADLIFVVSLDAYSPQTLPNAVALAGQAAKRWGQGGMIEATTTIAANAQVDIPEDTRTTTAAPAAQWPDACALLAPDDVRKVFGDMKIDPPRKMMGQLTHESRINRTEDLPHPISCHYEATRSDLIDGQRKIVSNSIQMRVANMAATPELAKRNYDIARKVGDAKSDVAGLGDAAAITPLNAIYIRKGLLTVELRVGGDTRDRALYDDATRRVNELAKLVAAKLP